MIKLVASDMDGTLLDSKKNVPSEFKEVLDKLEEKDVKFVVASGRQYQNLFNMFNKYSKNLTYICDNGAIVFNGNKELVSASELNKESIIKAVEIARTIENTSIILCGLKSAYTENDGEFFMENGSLYYDELMMLDDVLDALDFDDKICKIALFHDISSEKYLKDEFTSLEDEFLICVSSQYWIDFMNPGVNKGQAIEALQKYYGVGYDETMAFGDYLNDYEMMQSCKYSYAMENAHPQLKEVSNYQAKSNDENGVMEVIKEYFEI